MNITGSNERLGLIMARVAIMAALACSANPALALSQSTSNLNTELDDLEVELTAELSAELSLAILASPTELSSIIQTDTARTQWEDDWENVVAQENGYLYEEHLKRQRKAMIVGLSAGAAAAVLTALIVCIHDDDKPGCPDNAPLWTLGVGTSVGIVSGLITQFTSKTSSSSLTQENSEWTMLEQHEAEDIALAAELVAEILDSQVYDEL